MRLSVIVPLYNVEDYIDRTIFCLKNQLYKDIEVILVNDGSTDLTYNKIKNIKNINKNFKVINLEKNKGYGNACNIGINESNGDYIAIYEPDDYITIDFYKCLMDIVIKNKNIDIVKYNGIWGVKNKEIRKIYTWNNKYINKEIKAIEFKRFWRSHPSIYNAIYRKKFIIEKKILFCDTPQAAFQDAMFVVSLYYSNPIVYIVGKAKYFYEMHENQSINFPDCKIDSIIESWNKELQWLKNNNYKNFDFFLYKIYMQVKNILKKISNENKIKLRKNFYSIKKKCGNKFFLQDEISTKIEKIRYIFF